MIIVMLQLFFIGYSVTGSSTQVQLHVLVLPIHSSNHCSFLNFKLALFDEELFWRCIDDRPHEKRNGILLNGRIFHIRLLFCFIASVFVSVRFCRLLEITPLQLFSQFDSHLF